jgi:hypothetical protein
VSRKCTKEAGEARRKEIDAWQYIRGSDKPPQPISRVRVLRVKLMKHLLAIFVFLIAFISGSVLSHLYERADNLSLRYNLWKVGLWPVSDQRAYSIMSENIKGMSKEEVRAVFPGAHDRPAHEGEWLHDYEAGYESGTYGAVNILWLDYNEIVVFFENGRVTKWSYLKG